MRLLYVRYFFCVHCICCILLLYRNYSLLSTLDQIFDNLFHCKTRCSEPEHIWCSGAFQVSRIFSDFIAVACCGTSDCGVAVVWWRYLGANFKSLVTSCDWLWRLNVTLAVLEHCSWLVFFYWPIFCFLLCGNSPVCVTEIYRVCKALRILPGCLSVCTILSLHKLPKALYMLRAITS